MNHEDILEETINEEISIDLLREQNQKLASRVAFLTHQVDDLVSGIDHGLIVLRASQRMLDQNPEREVVQGALIAAQMILTDAFQAVPPTPADNSDIPF